LTRFGHRTNFTSEEIWQRRRIAFNAGFMSVPLANSSLFDDLDEVLRNGSPDKRVDMLRRVTDLFLNDADRLNEQQIGVFDDVLTHLITKIEAKALAEISARLAPVENAPRDVTLRLARHEAIAVAEPVLTHSTRLTTHDLVEIARTSGQEHLLAISGRPNIESDVTDVLLDRGNDAVVHKVAANSGAKLSENGFAALLKASETDEKLAVRTGLRLDIPVRILRELLMRATEVVRSKLLSRAPGELQDEIRFALQAASEAVDRESSAPRDFQAAKSFVELLQKNGELDESTLLGFARAGKYEEMVVATSLLCSASLEIIKPLMQSPRDDGLLVPCKVADLEWGTVDAIMDAKLSSTSRPEQDRERLKNDFAKLTKANAQRLLRFWQVRHVSAKSAS
jgi:uncharacterized protein (DUF2336 family)